MSQQREDGELWATLTQETAVRFPFATQSSLFLNHDHDHYITLTAAIIAIMTTEVPHLKAQGSHFNPNHDLFLDCKVECCYLLEHSKNIIQQKFVTILKGKNK